MREKIPFDFIYEFLPAEKIEIKKMFGHQCLYFEGLMVMFMISKSGNSDNGICLATSKQHLKSLNKEIKSLRHLESYGREATNWRLIPSDSNEFESDSEIACSLILKRDPRIGREPKRKKTISATGNSNSPKRRQLSFS